MAPSTTKNYRGIKTIENYRNPPAPKLNYNKKEP